jgi:hypothetical protein
MHNSIKVVSPIIIHGLEALIVRKPGFDNLGVSPLVLKDVQNLGASAAKFADAMITKDPVCLNIFASLPNAWLMISTGKYQAFGDCAQGNRRC